MYLFELKGRKRKEKKEAGISNEEEKQLGE